MFKEHKDAKKLQNKNAAASQLVFLGIAQTPALGTAEHTFFFSGILKDKGHSSIAYISF